MGNFFTGENFSLEGGITFPQNSYNPTQDTVKENHIGSAVSGRIRYKEIDLQLEKYYKFSAFLK